MAVPARRFGLVADGGLLRHGLDGPAEGLTIGIVKKTEAQPLIEALLAEINGNLSTENFRRGSLDASKIFDIGSLRLAGIRDVVPVATLPTVKKDGEIVYFQTSAMATAGVLWTLKWSGANNRWESIGGPPLSSVVNGANTAAPPGISGNFITLTGGPSLVLPVAGTYYLRHGCVIAYTTGGPGREFFDADIGIVASGTLGIMASGWTDIASSGSGPKTSLMSAGEWTFASASTIEQRYREFSDTTTLSASVRWLEVIPKYL